MFAGNMEENKKTDLQNEKLKIPLEEIDNFDIPNDKLLAEEFTEDQIRYRLHCNDFNRSNSRTSSTRKENNLDSFKRDKN